MSIVSRRTLLRNTALLAVVGAGSSLLAACSGSSAPATAPPEKAAPTTQAAEAPGAATAPAGGSPTAAVTAAPTTAPAAKATVATGPVTIEYMSTDGGNAPTEAYFKQAVDAFHSQHPNVTVKLLGMKVSHTAAMDQFKTLAAAGNIPDIYGRDDTSIADDISAGLDIPLDPYIQEAKLDLTDFPKSFIDHATVGGKVYGVPGGISADVLNYRTDLFEKAKVTPPTTWDQVVKTSKTLQSSLNRKYPFSFDPTAAWFASDWIYQAGGQLMSKDLAKFTFDAAGTVKGIQFMHDLIWKDKVVDPNVGKIQGGPAALFGTNEAAMFQAGGWQVDMTITYPKLKGKYNVALLPCDVACADVAGGYLFMIAKHSKYPETAFSWLDFLVSPDQQFQLLKIQKQGPARISVYQSSQFKSEFPLWVAHGTAVKNSRSLPSRPQFSKAYFEIFQGGLQGMLADPNANIAEKLKGLNDQANQLLHQ